MPIPRPHSKPCILYNHFLDAALEEVARLWSKREPWVDLNLQRSYLQFRQPKDRRCHFEILVRSKEIWLCLDFESGSQEWIRSVAGNIMDRRSQIDQVLGEPLEGEVDDYRTMARVHVARDYDRDSRADAQTAVEDMRKFMDALEPHLKKALAEVGEIEKA